MRVLNPFILGVAMATFITAAPPTIANLESLNFPGNFLTSTLEGRDTGKLINCPASPNSCGVVTFQNGQYTTFGQGICMQLGNGIQSIYVAKCYCSLWNTCTGNAGKDTFLAGMMMCEKPRTMDTLDKEVKFISCGGMN